MSTIVIEIDGVDITDDVVIQRCQFESKVNGGVGLANLRVRDDAHTYDFTTGKSLTLDVDSVRIWGGFVIEARKTYALTSDTTDPTSVSRMWDITGIDYNELFNKRFVFKQSNPIGKIDFSYPVGTYDDIIVNDIFDNYLTIGGDGLSNSGVDRVSIAILDLPGTGKSGSIASAGTSWRGVMDRIQRVTGAVYFINPSKVLNYRDAEEPTSIYTLTDQPSGGNDVGFQSVTLLEDGTKLINDMLVWGTSKGASGWVISRIQDSTSISDHGRWQSGALTSVYRQASADFIANTYVYGTPQSHRGHKDDARTFTIRVFEPKFQAGDVVDLELNIFGYTESLPIRKMTTSFVNPHTAIFDLMLSYDIDQPYTFSEYIFPRFSIDVCPPGYYRAPNGKCVPITIVVPPQPRCNCNPDNLGEVVDDFEGRVASAPTTSPGSVVPGKWWGATSTIGPGGSPSWDIDDVMPNPGTGFNGESTAYITGGIATLQFTPTGAGDTGRDASAYIQQFYGGADYDSDVLAKVRLSGSSSTSDAGPYVQLNYGPTTGSGSTSISWNLNSSSSSYGVGTGPSMVIDTFTSAGSEFGAQATPVDLRDGAWWWYRLSRTAGTMKLRYWPDGSTEPLSWDIVKAFTGTPTNWIGGASGTNGASVYIEIIPGSGSDGLYGPLRFDIDYLEVGGVNLCADVQFDDFNRTVASGWGTSSTGVTWTPGYTAVDTSVDGQAGIISQAVGVAATTTMETTSQPAAWSGDFTMSTRFTIVAASTSNQASAGWGVIESPRTGVFFPQVQLTKNGSGTPGNDTIGLLTTPSTGTSVAYASGWGIGTSHNLVWQKAGSNGRVKVWPVGAAEPAGWNLDVTSITEVTQAGFGVSTARSLGAGAKWEIAFDYIDFDYAGRPCYLDCSSTAVTFDDFEGRTLTGTWGTASGGFAWNTLGPGSSFRSVSGGKGILNQRDAGTAFHSNDFGQISEWTDDTTKGWYADFNMLALFDIAALPSTSLTDADPQWGVALSSAWPYDNSINQGIVIWQHNDTASNQDTIQYIGDTVNSSQIALGFSLVVGGSYYLRWRKTGTLHEITCWPVGTTEPDTVITITDTAYTPVVFAVRQIQGHARTGPSDQNAALDIEWHSIDFNGGGGPCFATSCASCDAFTNGGWHNIYSWLYDFQTTPAVDTYFRADTLGGQHPNGLIQYPDPPGTHYTSYVSYIGPVGSNQATFRGYIVKSPIATQTGAWTIINPSSPWTTSTPTTGNSPVGDTLASGLTSSDPFEFTLNPAFLDDGSAGFGVNAPVYQFILHMNNPGGTVDYTQNMHTDAAGTSSADFEVQNCYGCVLAGIGPASGTGVSPTGPVCETITYTGTTDTFHTTNAFTAGTLDIWVNGIRQTPQTYDGAAGTFTTHFDLTAGTDKLYVCYQSNGAPA